MKFMKAIRKIVTVVLAICLCVQIITSVDMNVSAAAEPSVTYRVHCQTYGWMKTVKDGGKAGTTGKSKRLEAIRISVATGGLQGGITYRTHVQSKGWMNWVSNGAV
jgi:uncharacterized protein YjdB